LRLRHGRRRTGIRINLHDASLDEQVQDADAGASQGSETEQPDEQPPRHTPATPNVELGWAIGRGQRGRDVPGLLRHLGGPRDVSVTKGSQW
jgi:hypothetical protein